MEVRRLPKNMYNYTWPEAPLPDNSLEEAVLGFLPDLNEAYSLCEVYLDVASWLLVIFFWYIGRRLKPILVGFLFRVA